MKILLLVLLTIILSYSSSFSEEIKMMECKLINTKRNCDPPDPYCTSSSFNKYHTNTNYNLLKYEKRVDGDQIYLRNEGKWEVFEGLDTKNIKKIVSLERKVLNNSGYYKYIVDKENQIFEFWFDFFYPSRKWSHTIVTNIGTDSLVRNYKCRKYTN